MTALPSPWPDVTSATTTEPLPCNVRSPEARSARTHPRAAAGTLQFPRSHVEPRTDRRRPPSSPLDAAASSDSVVVPVVVGIDHRRLVSVLWVTSPQVRNPAGGSAACASFAVERPWFWHISLTISVLSLGLAWEIATTPVEPLCLPRRAIPSRLLNLKARGIDLLPYDWQPVLAHHVQRAPRGARSRLRTV